MFSSKGAGCRMIIFWTTWYIVLFIRQCLQEFRPQGGCIMRKYVHVAYCSVQLHKLPEGRGIEGEWRHLLYTQFILL